MSENKDSQKFDPIAEVIKITKFVYDRRLTYSTGGNLILKYEGKYYSTPTGLGRYFLYELTPEDIIVCDKNRKIIQGKKKISVAADTHINILEEFPEYNASLHTHGEFSMVFASVKKPILNVNVPIDYYGGVVPVIEFNKDFKVLSKNIINKMKEIKKSRKEEFSRKVKDYIGYESIDSIPVALLIEGEGMMVAAPDMRFAVTTAEAIEESARCIVYSSGIFSSPFFKEK